jgi:hypothetical protein
MNEDGSFFRLNDPQIKENFWNITVNIELNSSQNSFQQKDTLYPFHWAQIP